MAYPQSVQDILSTTKEPAIGVDHYGLIFFINNAFTKEFGWTEKDLLGKSLTTIIPSYMRDTHRLGFSRFLATEKATLAGKPLPLGILLKDGTVTEAEHFILAEKKDNNWRFAATIVRRES